MWANTILIFIATYHQIFIHITKFAIFYQHIYSLNSKHGLGLKQSTYIYSHGRNKGHLIFGLRMSIFPSNSSKMNKASQSYISSHLPIYWTNNEHRETKSSSYPTTYMRQLRWFAGLLTATPNKELIEQLMSHLIPEKAHNHCDACCWAGDECSETRLTNLQFAANLTLTSPPLTCRGDQWKAKQSGFLK